MSPEPAPLYPQLETVALRHLVAYFTDLTEHDAAMCRKLDTGDAAIYAVRSYGTHFHIFRKASDPLPAAAARTAELALFQIEAVQFFAPDTLWFRIECTKPGFGIMSPTTFPCARAAVLAEHEMYTRQGVRQSTSPRANPLPQEATMAEYVVRFSCTLDVGTPENAATAIDLFYGLAEDIERKEDREIGFLVSIQPDEGGSVLWLRDDTTYDLEPVIRFVLLCAETFDLKGLWGFEYANTCASPRLDAFGGGAHVVDLTAREMAGWTNSQDWLNAALKRARPDA